MNPEQQANATLPHTPIQEAFGAIANLATTRNLWVLVQHNEMTGQTELFFKQGPDGFRTGKEIIDVLRVAVALVPPDSPPTPNP